MRPNASLLPLKKGYRRIPIFFKLWVLLMLANCLPAAATGYSQDLSLYLKDVPIQKVLKEIQKQSAYHFFYNEKLLQNTQNVTLNVSNSSLDAVLKICFKDQPIGYVIDEQQIVLKRKEPVDNTLSSAVQPVKPPINITGRITDEKGIGLAGSSIKLKGSEQGVAADLSGNFSMQVPDAGSVIVISSVGYKTQEVIVTSAKALTIVLTTEDSRMNEVIVVGYGRQKAATVTGAISTIKGDKLQAAPAINYTNSLAGRLPGLVAVTRSGEPGNDGSTLRIRGSNTLGDNSPLIVIDGIANRDMQRLNPSDIETITVLKDASAAIYGAQAANGVILITTKRGAQGKPKVTLSVNQGWSTPTVIPKMADAASYAQMINEINLYAGQQPRYTAADIDKYKANDDPWLYPNTDWFDATFKPTAQQRYASLSVNGGSESIKYLVSVGANFQDGIYKKSATNYSQANFRSNIDAKISKNINLSFDIAGRQENRNYPTRSASAIFSMLMRGKPNLPAYWPNGLNGPDIEYGDNPVVITTDQTGLDKTTRYNFESRVKLDINIPWVKGLSFTGNASIDKNIENRKLWQKPWYLYAWDQQSYDANHEPILVEGKKGYSAPQLTQSMNDANRLTLNGLINYERRFDDHNFKVLFGSERISGTAMNFSAFRKYFVSTAIDQLFAGGDLEKNNNGSASESARLNYFGRVNYDFREKYLFEFVWRYDGSYIFPEVKRFGFFPGVSVGWKASGEDFWKDNLAFINYFKLRGSWGQTGNDRIEAFQFLSSYGYNSSATGRMIFNMTEEQKILNELRIPNPNVTWEVANQANIGFDGELFDGKVKFSGDYFYNLRTNILWQRNASVPGSTGLTLPRENIGEVVNRGIEFQLGYKNRLGDFNYEVSVNGGYQKNKIKFWDETPGVPDYQKSTGYPMNSQLYYKAIGIFHSQKEVDDYPHWANARPGDVIFEDVNNDGKINGLDRERVYKTDIPTFIGGLNLDLAYKSFYATVFFQGATGALRNNYYEFSGESGNFLAEDVSGRWTATNTNSSKPRTWNRYGEYWRNGGNNTYWLEKSDYIRLKNLEVGYSLPSALLSKLHLDGLRIYVSGLNILTIDNFKDYDPETTSATAYPLNKVYNVGFNLNF